jgi:hypothetical protein
MTPSTALFHGSSTKADCMCGMWERGGVDAQDSSSSDTECFCSGRFCALYEVDYDINHVETTAYIQRQLVENVYEHSDEWGVRLLRWSLSPLCKIAAPELHFVANKEKGTLDVFQTGMTSSSITKLPCFRLEL